MMLLEWYKSQEASQMMLISLIGILGVRIVCILIWAYIESKRQ